MTAALELTGRAARGVARQLGAPPAVPGELRAALQVPADGCAGVRFGAPAAPSDPDAIAFMLRAVTRQ